MSEQQLEALRKQLLEQRAKTKAIADAQQEAAELARLEDEIAYEQAREKAYGDYGAGHVIGGEIKGAGFVVLRWPDQFTWRYFVNQGILRKDKLTEELCQGLVHKCLVYPALDKFKQMFDRNPNTAVQLAGKIIAAMAPEEDAEGKG